MILRSCSTTRIYYLLYITSEIVFVFKKIENNLKIGDKNTDLPGIISKRSKDIYEKSKAKKLKIRKE